MAEETPPPGDRGDGSGGDPFTAWYRDTIKANPDRYDPAHFTEGQARAWFPLWDASTGGFRSSKTDAAGRPIEGSSFAHPDECPPGTHAWGATACVPEGYQRPGGDTRPGGDYGPWDGGGFDGFGYQFPTFTAPTGSDVMSDPGYQFRLKEGLGAIEASASARGNLNTGGTLQGLQRYGQDYASQEYGSAFGRAKDAYATQLGRYQSEWDKYRFGRDEEFRRDQLIAGLSTPYYGGY